MLETDRQLIRRSKRYAEETRWLSWWHLGSTLAVMVGLVAAACLLEPWWIRLAAGVIAGLVQVRLFILYHDHLHGAILRGSRLARWWFTAYGLLALNPRSIWTRSHDHHHRNVGKAFGASIGSFPIMSTTEFGRASASERFVYAFSRHPVTIAGGYVTIFVYGMCARSFRVNPRLHADSGLALLVHLALVVTLALSAPSTLLFAVVVPITVASALGAYLFYAQHNYPDAKLLPRERWTYCGAALQTSSYIEMGPLARWFTGNIGFHHVHHVNARIPFYRLPAAMDGIQALQAPGVTSLRWHDVRRCLGLKLWDPVAGRMTGWPRPKPRPIRGGSSRTAA